jgi:hypothetical protein
MILPVDEWNFLLVEAQELSVELAHGRTPPG